MMCFADCSPQMPTVDDQICTTDFAAETCQGRNATSLKNQNSSLLPRTVPAGKFIGAACFASEAGRGREGESELFGFVATKQFASRAAAQKELLSYDILLPLSQESSPRGATCVAFAHLVHSVCE